MPDDERLVELLLRWEQSIEEGKELSAHQLCDEDERLCANLQKMIEGHRRLQSPVQFMPPGMTESASERADIQETSAGPPSTTSVDLSFLAPPQNENEIGRLGQCRILKVLGSGGMGVVLLGHDPDLDRLVALKVMLPQIAKNASSRARFLREARAAAKLRSDHIVTVHQVAEFRGVPYLVMEYLDGISLEHYLAEKQVLPLPRILQIARDICLGLADAHKQGLIQRDIKPSNIWLDATHNGRAKVLDFGLTRSENDANITDSGAVVGTPAYMAPEQARAENVDSRADLFSLGCVLYRHCTGMPPFQGGSTMAVLMAIGSHDPAPPFQVNQLVPISLSELTMRLLSKDPSNRPATAHEVVAAIHQIKRSSANGDSQLIDSGAPVARNKPSMTNTGPMTEEPVGSGSSRSFFRTGAILVGLFLAGISSLLCLQFGLFRDSRENGDFVIETDDPQFAFSVKKGEETLEDRKGNRKFSLNIVGGNNIAGEYELDVGKLDDGFSLKAKTVTVQRGQVFAWKSLIEPRKENASKSPSPAFENSVGMKFALIPKGKAWLGGGGGKFGVRGVECRIAFQLGVYEVTQEEWESVMEKNPSHFAPNGDGADRLRTIPAADIKRLPVESLTWTEVQTFLKRLNEREKGKGWEYRLPTELEWEYACRGGPMASWAESSFHYYFDNPTNTITADLANHDPKSKPKRTSRVGSYPPNRLGLFDMHGNVRELCDGDELIIKGEPRRVTRGGSWDQPTGSSLFRANSQGNWPPSQRNYGVGLRIARVPVSAMDLVIDEDAPNGWSVREDSGALIAVALSSKRNRVSAGCSNGSIKTWNLESGKFEHTFSRGTDPIYGLAYSLDGRFLGGCSKKGEVWAVTATDQKVLLEDRGPNAYRVAFSTDSSLFAATSVRSVKIWRTDDWSEFFSLPEQKSVVRGIAFRPDGQQFATCHVEYGNDNAPSNVRIWDIKSKERVQTLTGHRAGVNSVAFSPDGTRVASGSSDGTVKIWDPASGKELRSIDISQSWVSNVLFSRNGRFVIACCNDGHVRISDAITGAPVISLKGDSKTMASADLSDDDTTLAAVGGGSSGSGALNVWSLARRLSGPTK